MGINDIKKAIAETTHSNRWVATIVAGGVIGGAVGGPLGVVTGLGFGTLGYPPLLVAVKLGGFVKDTYQSYKHPEVVKGEEPAEVNQSHHVHFGSEPGKSSYAKAHAAGIPAGNSSHFTKEQELTRIASAENFGADLPFSPNSDRDTEQSEDVFEPEFKRM